MKRQRTAWRWPWTTARAHEGPNRSVRRFASVTAWAVEAKVLLGEAIRKYDAPLWPYTLTSTDGR